jgi:hypothetical protein
VRGGAGNGGGSRAPASPAVGAAPLSAAPAHVALSAGVVDFIEAATSADVRARLKRSLDRFGAFISALVPPVPFELVRPAHLLDFMLALYECDLAPATVVAYANAIDGERRRRDLPKLCGGVDYGAFVRAMRKQRPTHSKYTGNVPYAPRDLLPHLLPIRRSDTAERRFRAKRERTVFLVRVDTLARAGDLRNVMRSTVNDGLDPIGRRCVTFNLRSKQSARANVATDSNYVSHTCDAEQGGAKRTLCPACMLLDLCLEVEQLPGAASHDSVITDVTGDALSVDRTRSIVGDLLDRAGVARCFTSHSLRAAANQCLLLSGVDAAVVALRAGWSGPLGNASQRQHYTHHRFVQPVFAKILLL